MGHFSVADRCVAFDEVAAVWWHGIAVPSIVADTDIAYREWMSQELSSAISSVTTALRIPIFPDPDLVAAAGRKWRQLRVAADLGFLVPDSLVTSDPSSLASFSRLGPTVFKTLSHPEVHENNAPTRSVYTSLLTKDDVERAEYLRTSVGFFQRFVRKVRDIRLTVVDRELFAIAIESQHTKRTSVDWRHYYVARTPHYAIGVPAQIAERCVGLLRHFGLEYGAFDFAEDQSGNWWFLEVNANGLWAWLELLTGMPISQAIASHLSRLISA